MQIETERSPLGIARIFHTFNKKLRSGALCINFHAQAGTVYFEVTDSVEKHRTVNSVNGPSVKAKLHKLQLKHKFPTAPEDLEDY